MTTTCNKNKRKQLLIKAKAKHKRKCIAVCVVSFILLLCIPFGLWLFIWSFKNIIHNVNLNKGIWGMIGSLPLLLTGGFSAYAVFGFIPELRAGKIERIIYFNKEKYIPNTRHPKCCENSANGFSYSSKKKHPEDEEDHIVPRRRLSGVIIGSSNNIRGGDVVSIGRSKTFVIEGSKKQLKSGDVVFVNGKTKVVSGSHKNIKSGDWVELI